jgi:hypothetical protein
MAESIKNFVCFSAEWENVVDTLITIPISSGDKRSLAVSSTF